MNTYDIGNAYELGIQVRQEIPQRAPFTKRVVDVCDFVINELRLCLR